MGTGWRRAFCSSIPRDRENAIAEKHLSSSNTSPSPSPRSCYKLGGFLSGGSNPSTPRLQSQTVSSPSLRCRTTSATASTPSVHDSPRLQCKTTVTDAAEAMKKSPSFFQGSNPSSPRSPLGFSLLKARLRLSRSSCGICLQSVKTGQGTAIFTAECSHAFHFPCIAGHVKKQGSLVCPVCNISWREVPLLAIHKNGMPPSISIEESELNHKEHNRGGTKEEKRGEREPSSLPYINTNQDQKSKPSDPRAYDDDEPLLSPTAGGRFIPIPEADEDGEEEPEDEIEEFQGFFPSSTIKTTTKGATTNGKDARNVEVKLLPEAAVISVGRSHETYVVAVKLKAPPPPARSNTTAPLLDPSRRAPIDLVTVLDVSGSMTGAKLQMLKRAMRLVISSLASSDRLSIVAFSASTKRLLPLRRMTPQGQRSARHIIDRLVCGQGTSVGDALRKATKVLEDRRERNPVASIMLLSDSQDEQVSTKVANRRCPSSQVSSTRFAHLEIPVQSFGFGENGGQEPSEDAFAKCVGGLLSVVVQDLRLQIGFCSGSAPAEITAVYSCSGRPTLLGSGKVRVGDLYAEEERELLVEMRVPAAAIGAHHVMTVRCCYKDPASQEMMYGREQSLLVPRAHAIRSSAPKIVMLRNQFVTTKAAAEAKRLVEQNELSSAHHLLASARALLMQSSSSISVDEYVRGLEVELVELQRRRQQQDNQIQRRRVERETPPAYLDENGEPLTPTSAWRAAERLAKVAIMRKSLNRVSDLHGFENARF
ncbi:E3 ubiquitin-protein ligase WAV3-like [Macadamia integrifolia]|uniref:E3 ubiquitin-protein ligase WAV3-like n=1 Tax=Macadamia integrifolia TaxID=60698 RepID=UPI001C4FE602|nr:E3 ubiquitin-protein ligase WAV3-like [Macadamia integrifolia]